MAAAAATEAHKAAGKKIAGLPVWAWLGIGVAGVFVVMKAQSNSSGAVNTQYVPANMSGTSGSGQQPVNVYLNGQQQAQNPGNDTTTGTGTTTTGTGTTTTGAGSTTAGTGSTAPVNSTPAGRGGTVYVVSNPNGAMVAATGNNAYNRATNGAGGQFINGQFDKGQYNLQTGQFMAATKAGQNLYDSYEQSRGNGARAGLLTTAPKVTSKRNTILPPAKKPLAKKPAKKPTKRIG